MSVNVAEDFIQSTLSRLSLREKIGQCFTIGYMDTFLRPDTVEAICKFNCSGLRLVPWEREGTAYKKGEDRRFKGGAILPTSGRRIGAATYATPKQYAETLNKLQGLALSRPCGIPLHFSIDQEGDSYNDYTRGGVNLFPSNMGLCATGDPENAYLAYNAVGQQLKAMGVTFVHSPVLDVNVDPCNPEMNFRCFSDDPKKVAEFGRAGLKGFQDAGIIAVAKHFPGRGNSADDAHYDLCYYPHNARQMHDIDLLPYRELIAAGLQSIMVAHTVYPGLGDPELPASVSPTIVTDLLRKEMGFEGVITTDSITMRGLMDKFGLAEACLRALEVGNDLVLFRGRVDELPEVFDHIEQAVDSGRMDETVLDTAIARVLKLKKDVGILDQPKIDVDATVEPINDPELIKRSLEMPAKTAILVKKGKAFPLTKDMRVLVAEQCGRYAWQCNDRWYHPGMLYEFMLEAADPAHLQGVECTMTGVDDLPRIEERIDDADVVVATSFYCRTVDHNYPLIEKIVALGKPVVAVTNNPFICEKLMKICDSVLLIFSGNPRGLQAACDILHGHSEPEGQWPLTYNKQPKP